MSTAAQIRTLLESIDNINKSEDEPDYNNPFARMLRGPSPEERKTAKNELLAVLHEKSNKRVDWHVEIPNHRSNNNPRSVTADFLEYDESKDAVTLQVGREDQKKWKFIYLLTYRLDDVEVYDKGDYLSAWFVMSKSKPVYYKKRPNPMAQVNNPAGRAPIGDRPDPYEM